MGRRSVNTTKSGKFMNPTDQARKEARKRELKKNKKQRHLVRTAVLKNKDPGQIISELDQLDEVEYNPTKPPALAEKVLKDKRKKLRETLERVMKLYQKEDPAYWSELKRVESDYERRRFHRIQYFEAVKQAENTSVEDIPLPDMIPGSGSGSGGAGGSASIADIPLPGEEGDTPEIHGILKKTSGQLPPVAIPPPTPTFQGRDPPGVPVGLPPDLSDMDEMSDEDDMEVDAVSSETKSKSVRFQSDDTREPSEKNKALSEMDRFMKEIEEETKKFMAEEDLQPPGTETEPASSHPKPTAASIDIPISTASDPPPSPPEPMETHPPLPPIQTTPSIPAAPHIPPPIIRPPPAGPPPPGPPPPVPQFFPPPPPGLPLGARMRFPPPPPMPLPPMRPGFNMPPGRPPAFGHGPPHGPRFRQALRPSSVFSSAPQIIKSDTKIVSETMIQAKPQIRSLSADVTRFIPSIIKQKKEDSDKPKRHEYQIGQSQAAARSLMQQPRPPQQSKDDAYAEFMKEMSGLL